MTKRIESVLQSYMDDCVSSRTKNAMEYSLMAGGKRIRPLLLYMVLEGYGVSEEKGDAFAAALEMIHTYSLIHDDLPAMDNDDLRRGRPTCHKQFDEAAAILAGDGLLTYAFAIASKADVSAEEKVQCISILADMAGPEGMVLGQTLDLAEENGVTDFEALKTIHKYKTGCLLSAPLMMGAVLSDHSDSISEWHEIGDIIGLAFQVQDDVLDVELTPEEFGKSNSDERNDKVTSVTLLGIEGAEKLMNELYDTAEEKINSMSGFRGGALVSMIEEMKQRRK